MTTIPQPKLHPLLGNIPEMDIDAPVQSMMRFARELGPIYRMTTPAGSSVVLSAEALVRDVCDERRFDKFVSAPLRTIRSFAGDGLFTAYTNEPNWGKAHRMLTPAFGPVAMRGYFDDMLDIAEQMFTKWERLGPNATHDIPDNMTRLTLDTIALSGFAYRFNSFYQREMHPFVESMVRALNESGMQNRRLPIQNRLMARTQRQYRADIALMHQITDDLIAQRRALPPEAAPRDLLGLMLTAQDPITGETLDDENIRNQLVTFLIAGHETTSGLLSFATYLLLTNPATLARARAVVDEVLGDEQPRYEHLAQLGYLDQVLRETLRLYPTAPAFALYAKEDTLLAETYPLKKGDPLFVLAPMLHRDPAVWPDPERFDPERFAPERVGSIPTHAWKPFGNGQRSCIGRAFALQEATLVLAMMLQRFDLELANPAYQLVIKETLTLKPDGLMVRARVRRHVRHSATPASAPAVEQPHASQHNTPLLVLYGSNSGASEAFARRIAADGESRGYAVQVAALDDYAGGVPTDTALTVVSASYNGQPPDNARQFLAWLEQVPAGSLAGLRYTVFGCGNRDWAETYQAVPTAIDTLLQAAGAAPFVARGAADARGDFFGDFEQWYTGYWQALGAATGVTSTAVDTSPLYTVEVVSSPATALVEANRLLFATITENRELVDMTSPLGRSKRHIAFALPEGMPYDAGDYLAVLPVNHPDLIARAARRFGLNPDAAVVVRSSRGTMAASLPTDRPVSVEELLGRHVELSAPATRKDLAFLARHNPCPPHRAELAALAEDASAYQEQVLAKRVSVLEMLERFPSCDMSFGQFLELLPAMRVRQYSISSSPRCDARTATLTVAVVDAPAWSGQGRYYGTASSYLARLQVGEQVPVAVRTPNVPFHPPEDNATPMVMLCAGTGLAPFRGFWQERAARKAAGEPTGPALLFFGCDHPDVDFLYRAELTRQEADGVVQVFPAFFRQPEGEVLFIQHRLWQERARVWQLVQEGAHLYLCGDGLRMAPAVRETLERIQQEATGGTPEQAREWLQSLERAGRFVADVFGAG